MLGLSGSCLTIIESVLGLRWSAKEDKSSVVSDCGDLSVEFTGYSSEFLQREFLSNFVEL